ncbi:MAG TPA: hypothetical protein DDW30_08335 [Clostridiales bacterium]|nr:hypothetical protein [Clostridiales bacterium]
MGNKRKRQLWYLSALCLLLALGCLLTACSGGGKPAENTREQAATEEPDGSTDGSFDAARDIPSRNLDRDFTILSAWDVSYWLENEDGADQVADTAYARTLLAEEKYGVTFYVSNANGDVLPPLQAANMSGDKCYDLVFPHPTEAMTTIMTKGYYANMAELDTMNLSADWYNRSQVQNYLTKNNKLYIIASDLTLNYQGFFCIVYNRDLYERFSFAEDMKTLVESGEWTVEKFNELLTETEFTLDGEPTGNETYGFLVNSAPSHRWTYAFGESTLVRKNDGTFEAGLKSANMTSIAEAYSSLLYTHGDSVRVESYYNSGIATSKNVESFRNGHGLFINWDVGSCFTTLHNLDFKMGYAPLPKLDGNQKEYRTICASGFFAIPQLCVSAEESGLILEFLSAYSYQYFRQAFFESVLTRKMSERLDDYKMLNFLHESKFFDFGYTLDEKETFINMLETAVVKNRAPSGVVVILKSGAASMKQILEYANNMP